MKIKESLLIFLLGLIIGVTVSPLASGRVEDFFISPVSLSMAETKDLILPMPEGEVLGAMTAGAVKPQTHFADLIKYDEDINTPTQNVDQNAISSPPPEKKGVLSKKSGQLTIALLGDSMADTMGEGLPYLEKSLKKYYPNYQFNLLNYGAGGTNIEYGIQRLTQDYTYLSKPIRALIAANPDIVIIESFAYNPWGSEKSDLDRHWLAMAKIVDILKTQSQAKIIFLATIAPNKANFGAGPAGVNWGKDQAWQHAEKIQKYLENTLRFADSQNLPVIDAYYPSLVNGDGNLTYINPGDHIHPSVAGCQFIADLITKKLVSLGWIK